MSKGDSNKTDFGQDNARNIEFEIDGPGNTYLDHPVIDNLLDAFVEMSATIWTLRDRQIILEKILAEKGIEVSEAIEQYVPSEDELAERRFEREELVNRLFGRFLRVDQSGGETK